MGCAGVYFTHDRYGSPIPWPPELLKWCYGDWQECGSAKGAHVKSVDKMGTLLKTLPSAWDMYVMKFLFYFTDMAFGLKLKRTAALSHLEVLGTLQQLRNQAVRPALSS